MRLTITGEDKGASSTIDSLTAKINQLGGGSLQQLGGALVANAGKLAALSAAGMVAFEAMKKVADVAMYFVDASSEAEQSEVRLVSALKATGSYSKEAAAGVLDWSNDLLLAKGVSDELSVSLIGQGATMGLTIEQSKRFVSAAADMESITGSVAGGFDQLARAATGDERALLTLGKQFGISKAEGLSFGQMLAAIEEKTNGAAAAKVATYRGEWKLLGEQLGNIAERVGKGLTERLTGLAHLANEVVKAATEATPVSQRLLEQIEKLNKAGKIGNFDIDVAMVKKNIEELTASASRLDIQQVAGQLETRFEAARDRYKAAAETYFEADNRHRQAFVVEFNESVQAFQVAAEQYRRYLALVKAGQKEAPAAATPRDPNDHGKFYEFTDLEAAIKRGQELRAKASEKRLKDEQAADKKSLEQAQFYALALQRLQEENDKISEQGAKNKAELEDYFREQNHTKWMRMLTSEASARAAEGAAEKQSIDTIVTELEKWQAKYKDLSAQHDAALRNIERREREHSRTMKEINEAAQSVADAKRGVKEAEMTPGEKYFSQLNAIEAKGNAALTSDPQDVEGLKEKIRLLKEYAVERANFLKEHPALDRETKRQGQKSEDQAISDAAWEASITKHEDAVEATTARLETVQNAIADAQAKVVAVNNAEAEIDQAKVDAIAVKMDTALAKMQEFSGKAEAMIAVLNTKVVIDFSTAAALARLQELKTLTQTLISDLIKAGLVEEGPGGRIQPGHGERNLNNAQGVGGTQGAQLRTQGQQRAASTPQVVINFHSSALTAKDMDRELATLVESGRSHTMRAVNKTQRRAS
jgi:hypothetical protein